MGGRAEKIFRRLLPPGNKGKSHNASAGEHAAVSGTTSKPHGLAHQVEIAMMDVYSLDGSQDWSVEDQKVQRIHVQRFSTKDSTENVRLQTLARFGDGNQSAESLGQSSRGSNGSTHRQKKTQDVFNNSLPSKLRPHPDQLDNGFQVDGVPVGDKVTVHHRGMMLPRPIETNVRLGHKAKKGTSNENFNGRQPTNTSHESKSKIRGCWWNETSAEKPQRRRRDYSRLHGEEEQKRAPFGARLVDYAKRRDPMTSLPGHTVTGALRGGHRRRLIRKLKLAPIDTETAAPNIILQSKVMIEEPVMEVSRPLLARGQTPVVNHSPKKAGRSERNISTPVGRIGERLTVFGNENKEHMVDITVGDNYNARFGELDTWEPVSLIFNIRVLEAYLNEIFERGAEGAPSQEPSDAFKICQLVEGFYIGGIKDDKVLNSPLVAGNLEHGDITWLRRRLTVRDSVRFNTSIRRQLIQLWNEVSTLPDPTDLDSPSGKLNSPLKYFNEVEEDEGQEVHFGNRIIIFEGYFCLHMAARVVSKCLLGTTLAGGERDYRGSQQDVIDQIAKSKLGNEHSLRRAEEDFSTDRGPENFPINFLRFIVLVLQLADSLISQPVLAHYRYFLGQYILAIRDCKPEVSKILNFQRNASIASDHSSDHTIIIPQEPDISENLDSKGSFDSLQASKSLQLQQQLSIPLVMVRDVSTESGGHDWQEGATATLDDNVRELDASVAQEYSANGSSIILMLSTSMSVQGSTELSEKSSMKTIEPFYQRLGNQAAIRTLTRSSLVEEGVKENIMGTPNQWTPNRWTPNQWTPQSDKINTDDIDAFQPDQKIIPMKDTEAHSVTEKEQDNSKSNGELRSSFSLRESSTGTLRCPAAISDVQNPPHASPYLSATPPIKLEKDFSGHFAQATMKDEGVLLRKTFIDIELNDQHHLQGTDIAASTKAVTKRTGMPHATYAYMDQLQPNKYPHRTMSQDPTGDLIKIINCPDIGVVNFEFLRRGIGARKLFKGVPMWAYSDRTSPFETFGLLRPMSCQPTHMYITPKADPDLRPYLKRYIQTFNTLGGRDCFIGDLSDSKKSLARTSDPRHLKKRLSSLVDVSTALPLSCDR